MRKAMYLVGSLALLSSASWATDYARVISSTALVEQVPVTRQSCVTENVMVPPQHSMGGAVLGGVAGGLLGNTIGHGNGQIAAAAIGAATGALVGDRMDNANQAGSVRPVQNCQNITSYESRTVGYRVEYEYAGRRYSTQLPRDPGPQVPVQVTIDPAFLGTASTMVTTPMPTPVPPGYYRRRGAY